MKLRTIVLLTTVPCSDALLTSRNPRQNNCKGFELRISFLDFLSPQKSKGNEGGVADNQNKLYLLDLLKAVPPNEATPKKLTSDILKAVEVLENDCQTPESDVIPRLAGNWELIWTAQDATRTSNNIFSTWINPLENQSYSNNPSGRSNPILPQNIQNNLEDIGVLSDRNSANTVVSTQSIDLRRNRVRNVVSFEANNPTNLFSKNGKTKGRITVDVQGAPNVADKRRIDVKFDACRVTILDSPIDFTIPLGIIGPTGWLRTVYVDDDIRITRGHKGSVFILSRIGGK